MSWFRKADHEDQDSHDEDDKNKEGASAGGGIPNDDAGSSDGGRVTSDEVETVTFRAKRSGQWYDAREVDVFLKRVGKTLSDYEKREKIRGDALKDILSNPAAEPVEVVSKRDAPGMGGAYDSPVNPFLLE